MPAKNLITLMLGLVLSCSFAYEAQGSDERPFLVLTADGKYRLPDGKTVLVNNSKTSGLQEAINRAVKDNYDLYVSGGDYKSKVYQCSTPVVFPPMQGKVIKFGAATLNFDGFTDPSRPGLVFDSCMNVTVECNAQIVYHLNGTALKFEPRNLLPVDDFTGPTIVASRFHFAAISHVNTPVAFVGKQGNIPREDTNACCVVISPQKSISRSEFSFIELLGGNFGLRVETPGKGSTFAFNHLRGLFIHEQFHTSVAAGTLDDSPLNKTMVGNQWNVHCAPSPNRRAIDAHGNRGYWIINTVAEKGPLDCGILTHSTTTGNTFVCPFLEGGITGAFTLENPGTNQFK